MASRHIRFSSLETASNPHRKPSSQGRSQTITSFPSSVDFPFANEVGLTWRYPLTGTHILKSEDGETKHCHDWDIYHKRITGYTLTHEHTHTHIYTHRIISYGFFNLIKKEQTKKFMTLWRTQDQLNQYCRRQWRCVFSESDDIRNIQRMIKGK